MIETATAIQFDKLAGSGRTRPGFITCEDSAGEPIELVAKLSSYCDLKETSLAMEVVSACLAGDLGLPVPQPYFVRLDPEWIASVSDADWAAAAQASCPLAFGSKRVPAGFNSWVVGSPLIGGAVQTAAAILLFDAIADNPDRREANPNCLQRGGDLRIIDHELCFSPLLLLDWKPPWELGALHSFETPGAHIFHAALRKKVVDWSPIRAAWHGLSDALLADYQASLPKEWAAAGPAVRKAVEKIRNARDNIDGCVAEVERLLK
jgi:hypothetical protein